MHFHSQLPGYQPTHLIRLRNLAQSWGIAEILIKDESTRFGLGAFKVLGGSYAVARLLCQKLGIDIQTIDFDYLTSDAAQKRMGHITLATATDGNHGRGVAWVAERLGLQAMIYMPKGTARSRVENIRCHGATVEVTGLNYDDTVRLCSHRARENGWHVIQDTAWEGYEDIPRWIMQGYMTMCVEAINQMREQGVHRPTHVFIQAGWAHLPAPWWVIWPDCFKTIPPASLSWSRIMPPAFFLPLLPEMVFPILSPETFPLLWPVWLVGSPTPLPGTFYGIL